MFAIAAPSLTFFFDLTMPFSTLWTLWEGHQQKKENIISWIITHTFSRVLLFCHSDPWCPSFQKQFSYLSKNKFCVPKDQELLQEKSRLPLQKEAWTAAILAGNLLFHSLPALLPGHSALDPMTPNRWTGEIAASPTFAVWHPRFFKLLLQNPREQLCLWVQWKEQWWRNKKSRVLDLRPTSAYQLAERPQRSHLVSPRLPNVRWK